MTIRKMIPDGEGVRLESATQADMSVEFDSPVFLHF